MPGTASGEKLFLDICEPELQPIKWSYVTGSTRNWIPGCVRYDLLDGWYPLRFYYNTKPRRTDGSSKSIVFETDDSGFWQNLCGAKMDPDSFLRMEYTGTDSHGGIVLPYSLQIHRNDTTGSSKVHDHCWVDERVRKDGVSQLLCEPRKTVGWDASGVATIIVTLEDPYSTIITKSEV
eukprot:CAMPEP_0197449008 /NCGR_PEP_ID=MMETSP1175-20131217/19872_1 /TAXON_ID=1003142 /ORGANISM="Triceratium dubium, Strain CCMP147" /LENGTH=177 /DNA_ID=CAMNT_0042980977 /DNA_START=100 /DNA_END=633 /DNA_ORIENTATION=-